jgi:hypothetical protein
VYPGTYAAHFDNQLASGNDAFIFMDAMCANADNVIFSAAKRGKRQR